MLHGFDTVIVTVCPQSSIVPVHVQPLPPLDIGTLPPNEPQQRLSDKFKFASPGMHSQGHPSAWHSPAGQLNVASSQLVFEWAIELPKPPSQQHVLESPEPLNENEPLIAIEALASGADTLPNGAEADATEPTLNHADEATAETLAISIS